MSRVGSSVLAFLILLAACESVGDSEVSAEIAARVARGHGVVLRMEEVAPFEWDRLHVFGPYATHAEIEQDLGFAWPEGRLVAIDGRKDISLLLFVAGHRVEGYVVHKRSKGDFAGLRRAGGYHRKEAVFRLDLGDGWPRMKVEGAG